MKKFITKYKFKIKYNTIQNELKKITKLTKLPNERFIENISKNPMETYKTFYNNQFNSNYNNIIIIKIISDINTRLNTCLDNIKMNSFKKSLEDLREEGIKILCDDKLKNILQKKDEFFNLEVFSQNNNFINTKRLYDFILNYIEIMYEIIKKYDKRIIGTYYTNFAKDFLPNLYSFGNNTQNFFTFQQLNEQFFINVRPLCLYPVYLKDIPNFSFQNNDPTNDEDLKPLIPLKYITESVEGKYIDFREITYHDIGHSHIMRRQDLYLFSTINKSPLELVEEWNRNKNWYVKEYTKLYDKNYCLYKTIIVYLFDIVHDRGYQFYFPILQQQFKAAKNFENLKSKIIRGDFSEITDEYTLNYLEDAKKWLIDCTEKFIIRDNLEKIQLYKNSFIIKKFPNVENFKGVPINVSFTNDDKIIITFSTNDTIKFTTLYEIELLTISTSEKESILTEEKIDFINKGMNFMEEKNLTSFQIFENGEINLSNDLLQELKLSKNTKKYLKNIEIFKLERLLKLWKNKISCNFSINKLPDIMESDSLLLNNENNSFTTENGLYFKLSEISIEKKPENKIKYINLDGHNRFVKKDLLRNSYIKYSNTNFPQNNPYVTLNDELELGIVDTKIHLEIAKGISSLLTRSIEDAKDIYKNGYLPDYIVQRAQLEYVSPYSVSNLWGKSGYRFVLSRFINNEIREIIGTALIANSKDTLFFFTNKYNNLIYSNLKNDVDFDISIDGKNKWFDKFDIPDIDQYKPSKLNQLANFSIDKNYRGLGLGKYLIEQIIQNYSILYSKNTISHSQPLICGHGLFQIADPSWRKFMEEIGFKLRFGAEQFFIEHEW
jgi:GNAT superfamily N-acetyltransferase